MSTERHARVKQLFQEALEWPRAGREAFLQQQCGGDASLLAEVREMLAVEDSSPDFLESNAIAGGLGGPPAPTPASLPAPLGPFKILRLLGEGGMGAVYEAEQERPHRKVALKVLHPGTGTPQMLRRFELESEVLARLEHPGIARIYEAGTNDSGRGPQPWFAMELIDGQPLTEHCALRSLSLEQRVELLAKVCDAVQHAHQRGIVHRDLKPANVLVDAGGQPKVLDFGIARASDGELQRATLRTDPGMIVGTLQYMSPEQAAAKPDAVDVRTDVYSLGVMLYELAAGRPPLDLARLPMHEALRRVLEDEPAALRTTGARVPADVSVIAHKALEKDKERRYGSAAELAADLRRFLRREPIVAHPPSRWYRLRRFAARNKVLVGGAAATFAALVAGLCVALWQRNEARVALARVEGVNRFLLSDLFASPSPEKLGRDARVVDVLGPAVRSAERAFAGQPRVAAEVLDAVGVSYRAIGLIPEAEQVTRRALALLGDDRGDPLTLRARGHLVVALSGLLRTGEALELGAAVVDESTRRLGADDPETLARRVDLAQARWDAGQLEQNIADLRAVGSDQARVLGAEDARTLATRAQLGVNLAANGAIEDGRKLLTETLAVQGRVLGAEHPETLTTRRHLAWILVLGSEWREAEAVYHEIMPAMTALYGKDHPYTAQTSVQMAQCPMHLGRLDEAEAMVRAACTDLERRLGKDHLWTQDAHLMLEEALFRKRDFAAAIREGAQVVEQRRAAGGENLAHALIKLGRSHQEAGEHRAAADAFREAAQIFRQAFAKPTDFLAQALYNLGVVTRDGGDAKGAIAPLREAMAIDTELWGADHFHVLGDRYNLARTLLAAGEPAEAVQQMRLVMASPARSKSEPWRQLCHEAVLGSALAEDRQDEEGERCLVEAITGLGKLGRGDDAPARQARASLVRMYERLGRTEDAARWRSGKQ